MAQKREKEETELKVPETLTLCTPPIPVASSNMSASDDRRSSPDRSDLKNGVVTGVIVDLRPNSLPEKPDLPKKRRSEAVELSDKSTGNSFKRREVNRCSGCKRKVGLIGFRCRCGEMFCSEHRYSDRHDCSYDYKAAGREVIARENPVVRAAKILKSPSFPFSPSFFLRSFRGGFDLLNKAPRSCFYGSFSYLLRVVKTGHQNCKMVKAYSQEHTYKHPWERVTSASWRKFADPENKRTLSHILQVDTLNHKLDSDSGKLYTTRAITIHAPGPWFLRKIVGQDICHCVESTVVDARTRSMQLATKNISLQKYVEVEEKIRYDPHPGNPNEWTICRQETSIRIKPLSKLASMAEKMEQKCVEKFQQNSAKGREVMERMCNYLEAESSSRARGISV
ncbi:hypothetical protein L1987_75679 [Smallanthus sonchifolius]|uniref:Uncharacterized protein n=1 Tax=Smallanthus sonchifolius TaxID=185202 RepID=A0ACB9A638_9ASTR|nr:hypothetical protein L1987_75679 [Smallanthus sonchifolius]